MTSFLKKSNNLTNPKKQFHIGIDQNRSVYCIN